MTGPRQVCTFFLDGLYFGLEVHDVQEVVRQAAITPVPLTAPAVSGLINLRGNIATAIDLRQRLGLAARPPSQEPIHLLVRHRSELISLLADRFSDVYDAPPEAFEQTPQTVDERVREVTAGVYKLPDRLLLLLELERVLDPAAIVTEAPGMGGDR